MRMLIAGVMLAAMMSSTVGRAAEPAVLDEVTVMALGALKGRAVVKTPGGKMQVLRLGDEIVGRNAIVSQILTDKLVLEEATLREGRS